MRLINKSIYAALTSFISFILLMLMFLSTAGDSRAQNNENEELAKTLARMDAVSEKFSSFEAKFIQKQYVALLKRFEPQETGEFYYTRDKNRAVQLRHEIVTPGVRITTIKGDSATIYQPATKQAQIYNLGKRGNLVEYLATGLGQSSDGLREQFEISYDGIEEIGGESCSILTFVPKDKSAAASVKSITIWINNSTGTPAQYKFLEPTNNYLLQTFSEEKLNGKIPADKFEQKLPNGTDILRVN